MSILGHENVRLKEYLHAKFLCFEMRLSYEVYFGIIFSFRELEHPNILKLQGQCTETLPFLAIMEFPPLVSK